MNYSSRQRPRYGFTLVELLVVIAIIGVLVALFMPAVQAAREAARQSQCRSQLKQISLANLMHHDVHGFLPSGGWHRKWAGDADRGFGKTQPGSWVFSILPYIEQQALFDLTRDGQANNVTASQRQLSRQLQQTPITILNCPSRRAPELFAYVLPPSEAAVNSDEATEVARSDYAANSGCIQCLNNCEGVPLQPLTYEQAEGFDFNIFPGAQHNGISFYASEVRLSEITDGTSNVYLVGEKYINPDHYLTGQDTGDDQSMYHGFSRDVNRWTNNTLLPKSDAASKTDVNVFGSAHPSVWHVSGVDGSVENVSYDIDPNVHAHRGHRSDGQVEATPKGGRGL